MKRLVAAFVVAFCAVLQAASPLQTHSGNDTNAETRATTQVRGTQERPLFVEGSVTTQRSDHQSSWEKEEGKQKAANDRLAIELSGLDTLFTGLLLVTAISQVALFVWQLRLISASANDAQKAAVAAQTSADAAKAQAGALMVAQRAWVFHMDVNWTPFKNGTLGDTDQQLDGYAFELNWINAGNTPAISGNLYSEGRVVNAGASAPVFAPPSDSPANESRRTTIAPHLRFSGTPYYVSSQQLDELRSRKVRLFLFGRLEYEDIFQLGQPRVTEVCLNVDINGEVVDNNGVRHPRFGFTPTGPQNTAT